MRSLKEKILEGWGMYSKKNLPTSHNDYFILWTAKINNQGNISWENGICKNTIFVDRYVWNELKGNNTEKMIKAEFRNQYEEKIVDYFKKEYENDVEVTIYVDFISGDEISLKPKYTITYTKYANKNINFPHTIEFKVPKEITKAQEKADKAREADELEKLEKIRQSKLNAEQQRKEWEELQGILSKLENIGCENSVGFDYDRVKNLKDIEQIELRKGYYLCYSLQGGVKWTVDSTD